MSEKDPRAETENPARSGGDAEVRFKWTRNDRNGGSKEEPKADAPRFAIDADQPATSPELPGAYCSTRRTPRTTLDSTAS